FYTWEVGRGAPLLDRFDCRRLAIDHRIPRHLLEAFILIESNRRPAWLRLLERVTLIANGLVFVLFATPIRNLSVGLLQVRLSVAAPLLDLPVKVVHERWITPTTRTTLPERVYLLRRLLLVVSDAANASIGAKHISDLIRRCHSLGDDGFYITLGNLYNGGAASAFGQHLSYGDV